MAAASAESRDGPANGAFIFFDLETTGLDPRGDRIIEIAALRVAAGDKVADRFHRLIRIDRPVPPFITSITGITDDMLEDQEPIETALPRFIDFVEDLPLVAYNVSFDMGFLGAAARRRGGCG
jgi:DNA polymerase III epsilon subunit family exonuclease